MPHIVRNISNFDGLMMKLALPIMGLQNIKPEDRDPKMPKAWRVILLTPQMMQEGNPFDGKAPKEEVHK